jgi:toxin ParE1/3/4
LTRYRVTRQAAADLRDIGRFTQERWGRSARIDYLQRIEKAFGLVAANPSLGRPRPELSGEVRTFPVGRHLAVYRVDEGGQMVVIRVVHQVMDYPPNAPGQ